MSEPAKPTAQATGTGTATAVAYPANYWDDPTLNLHFDAKDPSVDDEGAKKFKRKANSPLSYVKTLQTDLVTLGYLASKEATGLFSAPTKRALGRFQKHAKRVYRLIGSSKTADDVTAADVFAGTADGICKPDTAKEVQKWKSKGWVGPVGRFPATSLSEKGPGGGAGRLRSDAAAKWEAIIKSVTALGGTLAGPYGDTLRVLAKVTKDGASNFSFHYCGRAVDINQAFAAKRYFVAKDPVGSDLFWRIWCKTDKQDGTQGTKKTKGEIKFWDFVDKKEISIKEGFYFDLTAEIEAGGFERIKAHSNWETNYNGTEWWHFQFAADKQPTFQDELELIGKTEADIRAAGWSTDAELDHAPG